ncbi:MAG: DUF1211 domain-containing protein [Coriobacteriia bacterium]|nr:DUF1211 domain-containing protein [Coriobacteriia bacterium]
MTDRSATESAEATKRAFDRFVNFSDGVFAIAITLLALDVRLPDPGLGADALPLAPQLPALLPNLFAFMLSFVVIGGYWVAHRSLLRKVERLDGSIVWLNLLVLFFVVLLPIPTQIVAEYGDTTLGVEIYAGAMTLTGLSILGLIVYAKRAGLTQPDVDMRTSLIKAGLTPAVFAASMVVAVWSPAIATSLWWLVAVVHFVIDPAIGGDWSKLQRRRA